MSESRPHYRTTPTVPAEITFYEAASDEWEKKLVAKVRELRAVDKRVILLVDGARVFVYSAEPRGTIALE